MTEQIHDFKGIKILRQRQVSECTGLSRSAIYDKMDPRSDRYDPTFPRQIPLGKGSVGWDESAIQKWLASRVNANDTPRGSAGDSTMSTKTTAGGSRIDHSASTDNSRPVLKRLASPSGAEVKDEAIDNAPALLSADVAPIRATNSEVCITDQVSRETGSTPQSAASTQVIEPTSNPTLDPGFETDVEKLRLADARRLVAVFEKKCTATVRQIIEAHARQGQFVFYKDIMAAIDLSPARADDCALLELIS